MKIFVFEYATASGEKFFMEEGAAMKNLISCGLIKEGFEVVELESGCVNIKEEIAKKSGESDKVIMIAPNDKMLEFSGIIPGKKLLASNPFALEISCNKFKTYCALKNTVKMPETEIFNEKNIRTKYPLIIKPIYGSGCENLHFIRNELEFMKIKKNLNENYITQKFINGVHTSVSLFCGEKPFTASLNLQLIELGIESKYLGCLVPYEHKLKQKAFDAAKKAAEKLGLKGYIGMDFVLGDDAYLIEINPRITTSAIALNQSTGANIAVLHVKCFEKNTNIKEDIEKIKFSNTILLRKKSKYLIL